MYEFTLLDFSALDPSTLASIKTLADPADHFRLNSTPTTLAIGAFHSGQPVGLLFAELIKSDRVVHLHSLFVAEEHRNKKIATALLALLEKESAKRGFTTIFMLYPVTPPDAPIIEKLTKNFGWAEPKLHLFHCHYDLFKPDFNIPRLNKPFELPSDFQLFFWSELTREERLLLITQEAQGTFPVYVSPFKDEKAIEPINSLGLRYKGEVVGWMINHRIAPDVIDYSSLFVQSRLIHFPCATKLVSESINLQIKSSVKWGLFVVNFDKIELSWLRFLKRYLLPYSDKIVRINRTWQSL